MYKPDLVLSVMKELQTRFLCPFFLRRQSVDEAREVLQNVKLAGRDGQRLNVWECAEPDDLYQEEILSHVVRFVFGSPDTAGCGYLKLSGPVSNRWFNNLAVLLPGDVKLPVRPVASVRVRLVASVRVELFVSNYGVGVLSIALEPQRDELNIDQAKEFNYRLSQLRWTRRDAQEWTVGELHSPHPLEDEQSWDKAIFTITKQSLADLKAEGVADAVLQKLQAFQNQDVTGQDIKNTIGRKETVGCRSSILKCVNARHSPQAKGLIPALPDRNAPIDERLGRPGGRFTPYELVEKLLQPLKTSFKITEESLENLKSEGMADAVLEKLQNLKNRPVMGDETFPDVLKTTIGDELTDQVKSSILQHACLFKREVQERLSVYTVARFGKEVDFESAGVRARLAPLLSALAQVEESTHAGAPPDNVGISNAILNRRHWAGVGLLGAAHLVADQEPADLAFNAARVPRIVLKYFTPYLVVLLQQLTLHRIVEEACRKDTAAGLAELRARLLQFAVGGHFTHVSSREAIHRFYRMCQDGLEVQTALDYARQAIADLDAKYAVERQLRLTEDTALAVATTKQLQETMADNLTTVARVQRMVEWIEIIVVSYYVAALWHYIASDFEHELGHGVAIGTFGLAVLAGFIAAFKLQPWEHGERKPFKDAVVLAFRGATQRIHLADWWERMSAEASSLVQRFIQGIRRAWSHSKPDRDAVWLAIRKGAQRVQHLGSWAIQWVTAKMRRLWSRNKRKDVESSPDIFKQSEAPSHSSPDESGVRHTIAAENKSTDSKASSVEDR